MLGTKSSVQSLECQHPLCLCVLIPVPLSSAGRGGGLVSSSYGDYDLNRTENVGDKVYGDEDSGESNSVSILGSGLTCVINRF